MASSDWDCDWECERMEGRAEWHSSTSLMSLAGATQAHENIINNNNKNSTNLSALGWSCAI